MKRVIVLLAMLALVAAACGDDDGSGDCGNGVVDVAAGEGCDDGNGVDDDGCRNDCTFCGDEVLQDGETCDPPGEAGGASGNECRDDCTVCGDGVREDEVVRNHWRSSSLLLRLIPQRVSSSVFLESASWGPKRVSAGQYQRATASRAICLAFSISSVPNPICCASPWLSSPRSSAGP